jgi:hypothetical protein
MKYSGTITVLGDAGNIVFERELSQDEIIDAILSKDIVKFFVPGPGTNTRYSKKPRGPKPTGGGTAKEA